MDVGERDRLFCSALQFETCYELFVSEEGDFVKDGNVVDGEETQRERATRLVIEADVLDIWKLRGSTLVTGLGSICCTCLLLSSVQFICRGNVY